jgi:hypothetical protein
VPTASHQNCPPIASVPFNCINDLSASFHYWLFSVDSCDELFTTGVDKYFTTEWKRCLCRWCYFLWVPECKILWKSLICKHSTSGNSHKTFPGNCQEALRKFCMGCEEDEAKVLLESTERSTAHDQAYMRYSKSYPASDVIKTGNVRVTQHSGAFTKPLLLWKSNKYYLLVCVCMLACAYMHAHTCM